MRSIFTAVLGAALVIAGVVGSMRTGTRPAPASDGTFAVVGARVFDGERLVPRATVLVRNGTIAEVGPDVAVPGGVETIAGDGRTLLPGLIDAHTHAFGDALERALVFGVTTELDMFTDHRFAAARRSEQASPGGAPRRADLRSAGTLLTAPGGHGTEYGLPIPTVSSPADVPEWIDARIAEGSDYIKIVYDDGASYGLKLSTISRDTLRAAIDAGRRGGKLVVVHTGSLRGATDAIEAGASALIHIFADAPGDAAFADRVKAAGAFVIPTLSVTESVTGVASGASLVEDARVAPFLTGAERASLGASFPSRMASKQRMAYASGTVKRLHAVGVPILAGTDAPNPGTAHGSSIHRELELLVQAGLTPAAALQAATATPARAFALPDRGRIAPGLRADLVLVTGDPTRDITATREIVRIWKGGVPVNRPQPKGEPAPAADAGNGEVSDFEEGEPRAAFGLGWQVSTDSMMGGTSQADMHVVAGGAAGTSRALEVSGTVAPGAPFQWAGAIFFPAPVPMSPANLSRFKEIVFWVRGDGAEHQIMVFATKLGNVPAMRPFTAGPEWKEVVVPFGEFSGIDGSDIRGVLFSAGPRMGPFRFTIDEVRFR